PDTLVECCSDLWVDPAPFPGGILGKDVLQVDDDLFVRDELGFVRALAFQFDCPQIVSGQRMLRDTSCSKLFLEFGVRWHGIRHGGSQLFRRRDLPGTDLVRPERVRLLDRSRYVRLLRSGISPSSTQTGGMPSRPQRARMSGLRRALTDGSVPP